MEGYTKKINVLWVVDHLGFEGVMHGAGKFYLDTIPLLDENEINTVLCVVRKKDHLTKLFEDRGIKVRHLGRSKLDFRTILDLMKIVRKEKIDLIHTHGYGSDNFGRMIGRLLKVPTIIHAHDDCINYPWHQNLADFLLSRATWRGIAVSESVKGACIKKRRIGLHKLTVMHNGIFLRNFITLEKEQIEEEKKRLRISLNARVIGAVGRLRKEKGITYLIESAPKVLEVFPDTVFLIAGDGPLREELQNLSIQLGVKDNILFAGFRKDIPVVLSLVDIFVTPSLTEGSPLGIMEAMAMGRAIIATEVGGTKEILRDGENGYFVPAKNPGALAEKIIYLLKNNEEIRKLETNAKKESQKYDIILYAKKLEEYYSDLLSVDKNPLS